MTGARVYPWIAAAAAALLAGCGSGAERPTLAPPAEPRTIELSWVERGKSPRFVYRVERIVLGEDGWSAEVSVENPTGRDYQVAGPTIGLVLLETTSRKELSDLTSGLVTDPPILAPDRIAPRLPASLRAGTTWRGTLSGSTVLRDGTVVRVLFGRFRSADREGLVTWVTDHAVRL